MKQKSNIPNTFYVTKHLTTQFRAAKEIFSFFFLSFFIYLFYFLFIYFSHLQSMPRAFIKFATEI